MKTVFNNSIFIKFPIVLVIMVLLGTSCKEERSACLEPRSIFLRLGAYVFPDTVTAPVKVALANATLNPADNPKVWLANQKNISNLYLTLSPVADSCRWYIMPDSSLGISDTFTFYYTTQLHFISNACGYTHYFTIDSVTSTKYLIDSVSLTDRSVTNNANTEHLMLIFR